jgi:hypothetical protein
VIITAAYFLQNHLKKMKKKADACRVCLATQESSLKMLVIARKHNKRQQKKNLWGKDWIKENCSILMDMVLKSIISRNI